MPFKRLVDSVIDFHIDRNSSEVINIQSGTYTRQGVIPDNINIFDFATQEKINKFIADSRIVFTHGGTGSIVGSLSVHRKVVVMPRLAEFGEHNDNHQLEIAELFSSNGHILLWESGVELFSLLPVVESFIPVEYISNSIALENEIIADINDFLNE